MCIKSKDTYHTHPSSILACELYTRLLRRGVQRLCLPTNFVNNALVHRVVVVQHLEAQDRVLVLHAVNGPPDVPLAFAATKHPKHVKQ